MLDIFIKEKYSEFRKKTKIWIFVGLILKYLGGVILIVHNPEIEKLDFYTIIFLFIILIGFFIFINGCASFAKLKGYRRLIGIILAFSDLLGLIILFLLPDKPNKYEVFVKDLGNTFDKNFDK